ncbi:MAG: hypothetical protein EOP76_01365 [Variovorax sp.]|nr:MAG: hypothetical protein EOP76_01365 [Variovorax sp.]
MTASKRPPTPFIDPDDIGHNQSTNPEFNQLIAPLLSRRRLLGAGIASGGAALLAACGGGGSGGGGIGFPPVAIGSPRR